MVIRDKRLTGFMPFAYTGVTPNTPPNVKFYGRAPASDDLLSFIIGDLWVDETTSPISIWMLVKIEDTTATWLELTSTATIPWPVSDGGTGLATITANSLFVGAGTNPLVPLGAAADGQIPIGSTGADPVITTITGGAGIDVTNGAGSITVAVGGDVADTYDADTGSAVPAANVLTVAGGTSMSTTGAAATLTIDMDTDVATSYATDSGTATPASNILTIAGGTGISTSGSGSTVTVQRTPGSGFYAAGENLNESPAGTLNLNRNIRWPDTNAAGTTGLIYLGASGGSGGTIFMHNYDTVAAGQRSVFIGEQAGNLTNTATDAGNIGVGYKALTSLTSGESNCALGSEALTSLTTGDSNVACGDNCLANLTTGSYNVGLGGPITPGGTDGVGENYTSSESSNILINNAGVTAESNTIRIGTHGSGDRQQNKCFVAGIRGATTGVADAIQVLIDSSHQLGTVSSSIRFKDNIENMSTEGEDLLKLRPVTFEYKKHPGVRQYGLIAEEVKEIFPRLVVEDDGKPSTVKYHELPALLLDACQAAQKRIEELEMLLA